MAEALVINTGPMVALCLAGATEFVGRLPFEFLAPTEVAAEVAAGQRLGYRVVVPAWVSVVALEQPVGALGQIPCLRAKIEMHVKNTCLKRVDVPVGVKPVLRCCMELS